MRRESPGPAPIAGFLLGLLVMGLSSAGLLGCAFAVRSPAVARSPVAALPPRIARRSADYGFIATPSVRIEACDHSFSLASGKRFVPPFEVDAWYDKRMPAVDRGLDQSWSEALRRGAKQVRVSIGAEQLEGVLLLNTHALTSIGPGAFNYRIDITAENVSAARAGMVEVIHESVDSTDSSGRTISQYSWILWLAARPLGIRG